MGANLADFAPEERSAASQSNALRPPVPRAEKGEMREAEKGPAEGSVLAVKGLADIGVVMLNGLVMELPWDDEIELDGRKEAEGGMRRCIRRSRGGAERG